MCEPRGARTAPARHVPAPRRRCPGLQGKVSLSHSCACRDRTRQGLEPAASRHTGLAQPNPLSTSLCAALRVGRWEAASGYAQQCNKKHTHLCFGILPLREHSHSHEVPGRRAVLSENGTNLPCFPPCANEGNTDDLWGLRSVPQPCVHGESQTSKCHQNYPSPLTSSLERNIGWPLSMEIRTHSLKAESASLEFLPVVAAELQATHQTVLCCVPRSDCCTLLFLLSSCTAVLGLETLCSSAALLEAASGGGQCCHRTSAVLHNWPHLNCPTSETPPNVPKPHPAWSCALPGMGHQQIYWET